MLQKKLIKSVKKMSLIARKTKIVYKLSTCTLIAYSNQVNVTLQTKNLNKYWIMTNTHILN